MRFTLALSIVATLVVLANAVPQSAGRSAGIAIPITKRSTLLNPDKTVNFDALNSHIASIEAKISRGFRSFEINTGAPHPAAPIGVGAQKRGVADVLTDDNSELWYGSITVGMPPRTFLVDFDTGSSDLFLPAHNCDSTCSSHTLYDPSLSLTSKYLGQTFNLTYGDGSIVLGVQYVDTVSICGFTAIGQTLGVASTFPTEFQSSHFPADGLLGMGFQSISNYGASPVFTTLVNDGQLTESVFSFKLTASGSELYIGGSNSALYVGDFAYTPVTQEGYWQVNLESIQANGRTILGNLDAIIDTGTTLIVGPVSDIASLYEALGGKPAPSDVGKGFYTLPCDSFPDITFSFSGTPITVPGSVVNLGMVSYGSSECVSGIVGGNLGTSLWIMGDLFMQGVYTQFDYGNSRVGFAQLS